MFSITSFRCSGCGAPLDVTPETIATVCSYCGLLNWVREDLKDEVLVVEPMDEDLVLKRLEEFASRRGLGYAFRRANLYSYTLVLAPFYFVDVSASARYSGLVAVDVRRCRKTSRDTEVCWTETRKVYVSGVYGPSVSGIPIAGRRASRALSMAMLARRYSVDRPKAVQLGNARLGKSVWSNVLSIEIDGKTAMDMAVDQHLDRLREEVVEVIRSRAEDRVRMRGEIVVGSRVIWKRVTPVNVKASASKPTLLPMGIAVYKYGSGVYRAVVCGWDGQVMAIERPVGRVSRALWSAMAVAVSGLLGGLALALSVIGIALLILGGFASWFCVKRALAPVKLEVFGPRPKRVASEDFLMF